MKIQPYVGASLLAMNDDAVCLLDRSACIASRLAPTRALGRDINHG